MYSITLKWVVKHFLSLLAISQFTLATAIIVKEIVVVEKPGCIAKVLTDVGYKWINLEDDYKLIEDSQYSTSPEGDDPTLLWRPCVPFNITMSDVPLSDNSCQSIYVARNINNRSCENLGQFGNLTIRAGALELQYVNTEEAREKATVRLVCDGTKKQGSLTCIKDCETYTPTLEFTSKHVCLRDKINSQIPLIPHHNFSTGSMLLITVGFILLVYLLLGVIRGIIKGRSGCDRLPNSDFWVEIPLLVRDGCCFTFACRLPRSIYHRRKKPTNIYAPVAYDDKTPIVDI